MKDKILAYLKDRSAFSKELVRQVLNIQQANDAVCRSIMRALLKDDERFVCDETGRWRINPSYGKADENDLISKVVFTVVHLETFEQGRAFPEILAIAAQKVSDGQSIDRFCGFSDAVKTPDELSNIYPKDEMIKRFFDFLGSSVLVGFNAKKEVAILSHLYEDRAELDASSISLKTLAKRLFPEERFRTLEEMASVFGITWSDVHDPETKLKILVEVLFRILEMLEEIGVDTVPGLLDLQDSETRFIDHPRFDRSFLAELPNKPGVYFFKDQRRKIIYVGKAKDLKSRIHSYFCSYGQSVEKVGTLLSAAHDLDYEITGSELEALILEARLIKELKPPINSQIEVHERPTGYGKQNNLILVMPSAQEEVAELFLISEGGAFQQCRARKDLKNLADVREAIKNFFFSRKQRRSEERRWEAEICSSWLHKNKDRATYIDVGTMAHLNDCMRILTAHLKQSSGLERVIQR